jgi:hypothetical protein
MYYVVAGAMLKCTHGGMAPIPKGDSRLQISGAAAVTAGMEAGVSFAAGTPPCLFATAGGPSPCTATQAATSGISTKLTVGGVGVLLDSASGLATNAQDPSAQWSVALAGQQLLQEG